MHLPPILKKIKAFFSAFISKENKNRTSILLSIFLLVVLLISFIIPMLYFGRFLGTDDYTHLFHTNQMVISRGVSEFYKNVGAQVDDSGSDTNLVNYPFGLWLFGATIAKITGLPAITADFFYVILFLFILVGSFYFYSSLWLESREQKLFAVLFLISMPNSVIDFVSYWPSIFVVPFMLMVFYFFLKEQVDWKLLPIVWFSLFIIVVSHTGTFLFIIFFSIAFFLFYCLLWGKFLKQLYTVILSTFFIYIVTLEWFPQIAYQYEVKSRLFLLPGNFLASKFNFSLPLDLTRIFYENVLIEHQVIYAILFGASLFIIGELFFFIHKKTAMFFSKSEKFYAFSLPIKNLSNSVWASPLWLGPIQIIFSIVGVFHLDNKGKCLLITALSTVLLPNLIQTSQGISVATGSYREISYLIIIIPITATLGFWHVLDYLNDPSSRTKKLVSSVLWIIVCMAIIISPILGTAYYLPTIAGEDYVIGGMEWLGENGNHAEKVVGYTLRTVPIYTNMTDASYDLQMGSETTKFLNYLKNIYFVPKDQIKQVTDFRREFGVKYILSSDKLLQNLKGSRGILTIDSNPALTKIYSSNDFGIYEISTTENPSPETYIAKNISLKQGRGSYEIESDYYKVILSENAPVLKRFGTPEQNLLGNGYVREEFRISGSELSSDGDLFSIEDMEFTHEIKGDQIIYMTVLHNPKDQTHEGTLQVRYTFYPNVIKREYLVSNDWLIMRYSSQMNVQYSMRIFSPMSQFVVKNEKTRLEKHVSASEDTVTKNVNIEDLFLNNGNTGMYITFDTQFPQPSSVWYSGTLNNRSTVGITQTNAIKPGASFFSTQYLSMGNEYSAERNIQNLEGIKLIHYPDGITPVIVAGYGIRSDMENSFLINNSIPYSEVISQKTGSTYFDNYTTQETNIDTLKDMQKQDFFNRGFMPNSLNYNLDTLKILSIDRIPFVISSTSNTIAKGYRNPQIAYLNSEPTNVVLFPVSSPTSTSMLSQPDKDGVFSGWRSAIDTAAENDEMVLYLFQSQDMASSLYTEDFIRLFAYARVKGLTFTTLDILSDHFKQLQKIRYSGFIDCDSASIQVTNTNNLRVGNVTFSVTLPHLENGNYHVNGGDIIKKKCENDQCILYIRTEIPGYSTKNISIEPDMQRKSFRVEIPRQPVIEGSTIITIRDEEGNPLRNVDVIVDASYYQTDEKGAVHLDLERDYHKITVQSPGFEKYSSILNVKGRIYIIQQTIGEYFDR